MTPAFHGDGQWVPSAVEVSACSQGDVGGGSLLTPGDGTGRYRMSAASACLPAVHSFPRRSRCPQEEHAHADLANTRSAQ